MKAFIYNDDVSSHDSVARSGNCISISRGADPQSEQIEFFRLEKQ